MVDSVDLNTVAREDGFRERVSHFLLKKADAVLDEGTPDATELTLAKLLVYPAEANAADAGPIVDRFARLLVTVSAVSTALAANNFDHLTFTDANFETQVNLLWTTYAKSVV